MNQHQRSWRVTLLCAELLWLAQLKSTDSMQPLNKDEHAVDSAYRFETFSMDIPDRTDYQIAQMHAATCCKYQWLCT